MLEHIFTRSTRFSKVPQTEDSEALISDSNCTEASGKHARPGISRFSLLLLFLVSITVAALGGAFLGSRWRNNPNLRCTEFVSQYSPVLRDVDMSYRMVAFNGSLLKENVFRQDAGPEVDAAWSSLGVDYRSAVVPLDQAEKSGLSPSQVQVSEKYGGGFPANVEGLHHLHCLNLLRQALYYNFDYYHERGQGAFKNPDYIVRLHVTHCLDILRQQLMCTVDIGVLGQVWWNREEPQAYPDFNTVHKCRNFEGVRQWAEAHQAPAEVPPDYLKPPGDYDVYEAIP